MRSSKIRRIDPSIDSLLGLLPQLGILPGRQLSTLCRLPYVLRQEIIDFWDGGTVAIVVRHFRESSENIVYFEMTESIPSRVVRSVQEAERLNLRWCNVSELSPDVLSWYIPTLFGYFAEDRTRKIVLVFRNFLFGSRVKLDLVTAQKSLIWLPLCQMQNLIVHLEIENLEETENRLSLRRFRVDGFWPHTSGQGCLSLFSLEVRHSLRFVSHPRDENRCLARVLPEFAQQLNCVDKLHLCERCEFPHPVVILPALTNVSSLLLKGTRPSRLPPDSLKELIVAGQNPRSPLFNLGTWIQSEIKGRASLRKLCLWSVSDVPSDVLLDTLLTLRSLVIFKTDADIPFDKWKEAGVSFPTVKSLDCVLKSDVSIIEGLLVVVPRVEHLRLSCVAVAVESLRILSQHETLQSLVLYLSLSSSIPPNESLRVVLASSLLSFSAQFVLSPRLVSVLESSQSSSLHHLCISLYIETERDLNARVNRFLSACLSLNNLSRLCVTLPEGHGITVTPEVLSALRRSELRYFELQKEMLIEELWVE